MNRNWLTPQPIVPELREDETMKETRTACETMTGWSRRPLDQRTSSSVGVSAKSPREIADQGSKNGLVFHPA